MDDSIWNPWHGCKKYSEGCAHCYVYRRDESIGKDASLVSKTAAFDLGVRRKRDGSYKLAPGGEVYLCMTSDFFLDEADAWRGEIWAMLRERADLRVRIITKRVLRVAECLPADWGAGYPNVTLGATMENQRQCDIRLPVFLDLPVAKRFVICEPLLGPIDFRGRLEAEKIDSVTVGGETGESARVCDYDWVTDIRRQCLASGVSFHFKQTGERFVKDGREYRVPRMLGQAQARRANIDTRGRFS